MREISLQRDNSENSKQIFPEKELHEVSVPISTFMCLLSNLYIPTISLPILLQENMCTYPGNIHKSLTYT